MHAVNEDDEHAARSADRQLFTFRLGEERYGVDIEHVAEIVERATVTPVPNTQRSVVGVMDLRGQTTTVIDPTRVLDVGDDRTDGRIVVLDADDSEYVESVSWVVDDVYGVAGVDEDDIEDPPDRQADLLEGVHHGEDGFTMLIDPETVARRAAET